MVTWKSDQHLKQKASNFVGAVHLVDEKHRRLVGLRQRGEQRAFSRNCRLKICCSCSSTVRPLPLVQLDAQQLLGVIPFVGGLC